MLLSITTMHQPAMDLGFLLHKHPERFQSFNLTFGQAHVFYPHATAERCTACLMLDVDPVRLIRGKSIHHAFLLGQYVNDRPYVASSFMSVAISRVLGTAMQGQCQARAELVKEAIPLEARLEVLPVRGGERFLHEVFEPLGYAVSCQRHVLDETFPDWGESPYYSVALQHTTSLAKLLTHLYVLIPVFDNAKHYYVGQEELDKLLEKGSGWLANHPLKEEIARRYLRFQRSLLREALARLAEDELPEDDAEDSAPTQQAEETIERPLSLNEQRMAAVLAALRESGAKSVLDLGCGEGKLLRELLKERQFERIVGMDVSIRALEIAKDRLKLDRLPERQAQRIALLHGSLTYRDRRLESFDAAAVVEVVEHLDPPRLSAFERVLFECARPKTVVLTTPNREYNVKWESLPAGRFRHADHRFEWTREEFQAWAGNVAGKFGYEVRYLPVGPLDEVVGPPTQMGVFERKN